MQESKIENYLKKQVELIGGKAYKFVSPGVAGVPDRIVLLPGGRIFFIELKAPDKKLKKLQEYRAKELRNLEFEVRVVDSMVKVDLFIEEVVL